MLAELGSLTLIAEKTDHHVETHIKGQAGGSLLKSRRFLPLFLVQFLGAFNDNVFKNALVMLMTFKLAATMGWGETTTINMIMVLFLFPSIFLSAVSGQIADRFEKSLLIRWTKIGEIGIMVLAAIGFWLELPWLLMGTIFLAGIQISIFGPLKYGILPDHLAKNGKGVRKGKEKRGQSLPIDKKRGQSLPIDMQEII